MHNYEDDIEIDEPENGVEERPPIVDSPNLSETPGFTPLEGKYYYHLRITDQTTKEIIASGLNNFSDRYVVAEERSSSNVLHFHCLIECSIPHGIKEQKKFYSVAKRSLSLPKGGFSTSPMKSTDLLTYVLKDGDFISKGFDTTQLKIAQKKSYVKYDKKAFAMKQHDLEDRFLTDRLSKQMFMEAFIRLKVDHKQIICKTYLVKYFTMLIMKKNPANIRQYVQQIEDRIESDFVGINFDSNKYSIN